MNAVWLERLSSYRTSPQALESAKALLMLKDARRFYLLNRYGVRLAPISYAQCQTIESVLLCEARNAKIFWRAYAKLLPAWCADFARRPHKTDAVNRLLDVGYHHLASLTEKIILSKDITPALGLIHRAHRAQSKPLVYDLMELFRADTVDFALLRFLRLKKKPIADASPHIGHFLHEINGLSEKRYYLRDFKQCHRYSYYMELQIMKFIKAVNHREVFKPLTLPRRHESRCRKLTNDVEGVTLQAGVL